LPCVNLYEVFSGILHCPRLARRIAFRAQHTEVRRCARDCASLSKQSQRGVVASTRRDRSA
jgi:hypothetical protein